MTTEKAEGSSQPLTTLEEYEMAVDEISELIDLDPVPQSFFGRELVRLVTLAQQFERERGMCPTHDPELLPPWRRSNV